MAEISGLTSAIGELTDGLIGNPIATGVGGAVGGAIVGGVVTAAVIKSKRKKSAKRKYSKSRSRKTKSRKSYKRKPYTAGKRKDTSHRRIRYTKRGQPYVIMSSGKARFISIKSAKNSRARKGGRY